MDKVNAIMDCIFQFDMGFKFLALVIDIKSFIQMIFYTNTLELSK